ncbi:hypothetical protein [Malonomonas rubra]|uniref:hypothetical protein n=1 Tax=Malonomonas rubra TaxID=57040 RepID=UPI0026F2CB7F|nr:hypothetical protein [Malonomonas rubra]
MPIKPLNSFILLILLFALTSCAATTSSRQVHFDGKNSQAVALSPYYLPPPEEKRTDLAWALTLKVSDGVPYFGLIKPNQLLADPLFRYFTEINLQSSNFVPGSQTSVAIEGCQGKYLLETEINSQGEVNGKINYQNFSDNCSLSYDATVPFSGQLDLATGQLTVMLNYKDLPAQMGVRNFRLSGQLQLSLNAFAGEKQKYTAKVEMDLVEIGGQQYHLAQTQLSWNLAAPYPQFAIAGKISFEQYGEVQLVTDSPLISHSKNGPPFDGMLIFSGADGAWRRLYFPKSTDPGALRIDGSNGMKTMGKI